MKSCISWALNEMVDSATIYSSNCSHLSFFSFFLPPIRLCARFNRALHCALGGLVHWITIDKNRFEWLSESESEREERRIFIHYSSHILMQPLCTENRPLIYSFYGAFVRKKRKKKKMTMQEGGSGWLKFPQLALQSQHTAAYEVHRNALKKPGLDPLSFSLSFSLAEYEKIDFLISQ